jgi:hypothetical protein
VTRELCFSLAERHADRRPGTLCLAAGYRPAVCWPLIRGLSLWCKLLISLHYSSPKQLTDD